jgi:hypothetical protein
VTIKLVVTVAPSASVATTVIVALPDCPFVGVNLVLIFVALVAVVVTLEFEINEVLLDVVVKDH